jgi:hypothetical protein
LGVVHHLLKKRELAVPKVRVWRIVSLHDDTLCIEAVAATSPVEAAGSWAEKMLLGDEESLEEGEQDYPLPISWISLIWCHPVFTLCEARSMGVGLEPIVLHPVELKMALQSTDENCYLAAIVEQKVGEGMDIDKCHRFTLSDFPPHIQHRHRVALAAWEAVHQGKPHTFLH